MPDELIPYEPDYQDKLDLINETRKETAQEIFNELESDFENWVVPCASIKDAYMCFEPEKWEAIKNKYLK